MPSGSRGLLRVLASPKRGNQSEPCLCLYIAIGSNQTTFHPFYLPEIRSMLIAFVQAARVSALQAAYRKAEAAHPRDDVPSAGQIKSLGLIDPKQEENGVKPAKLFPAYKA